MMSGQSLYQRNLAFFQRDNQGILDQINNKNAGGRYHLCPARIEGMFYIESGDEGSLLLHSRYNPVREAEMWAEKQDLDAINHVILFGFGLGYHVEALLGRNPQLQLYIYEPDLEVFLATLEYRDWTAFPWERIYIILEDGSGKYNGFIEHVLNLVKSGWGFLSIPSFERCFSGRFSELKDSLSIKKTAYLDSLKTNIFFEKEWTVNALKNLPYILQCESIYCCKDELQGRTVVMTASGPSLNEAIPFLKELKEKRKALVVAAGTSVNGLLRHGLMPDFFVSYDPFPGNYKALKPALPEGVPFVFGSTINNDVVKNHVGPKAHFILGQDTLFSYLKGGLDPFEVVNDAPSIAVVTLQLLDKLGVEEVILAGQDLAFQGERYYAEGISVARSESVKDEDKAEAFEVEANDGGTVLTNKSFNRMRESMESVIKRASISRIINTSPKGAKIAGTVFRDWPQLVGDLPCDRHYRPISLNQDDTASSLRSVRRRINTTLADIETDFNNVMQEIGEFVSQDLDAEKQQMKYDRIGRCLSHLTSSRGYAAFIIPMIRNEDHLLKKTLIDLPRMSWDEKQTFISKDLMMYLQGVQLSLVKLKEAMATFHPVQKTEDIC